MGRDREKVAIATLDVRWIRSCEATYLNVINVRVRKIILIAPLVGLSALLSSCTGIVGVHACMSERKLAFLIDDVPAWFSREAAVPTDVSVYGNPSNADIWWITALPSDLIKPIRSELPRRKIIYGTELLGWQVNKAPASLVLGRDYTVEIATSGGRNGKDSFKFGPSLPPC